jgi:allantoin racemase
MTQKILYIDPVGVEVVAEGRQFLASQEQEGTELTMIALPRGPHHLEYAYYEALVLVDILHLVKQAEQQGFDAAIIGCFYDVGLQAAREVTERMAIVAPCEASVHIASTLGDKFSIIVGRRKWIPEMRENVVRYGMKERLASFQSRRFIQVGREAIERDGAEVLVLGCTATYGFYRELQEELGVPVIDSMIAAFKTAEFAAELKNHFGWSHSKIGGYESPPPEESAPWRLEEQYDFGDMRNWLRRAAKAAKSGEATQTRED